MEQRNQKSLLVNSFLLYTFGRPSFIAMWRESWADMEDAMRRFGYAAIAIVNL